MKSLPFKLVSVITALLFASCRSNPNELDQIPMGIKPPTAWISANETISSSSEDTFNNWLESFENEFLENAVRNAWKANPSLTAMAERTIARGEEAVIDGATLFPQANLGLNASRSKRNLIGFNLPNGSSSFTTESFTTGINLSWEIDLWGKIRNRNNSASKRFEGSIAEYEGARLSLAGQIAKAWYGIIESEQQLKLASQMTETFKQNKAFVENRFTNGLATSLDRDLAESAFAGSQANKTMRLRLRDSLVRDLELVLGEYPMGRLDLNESDQLPVLVLSDLPPPPASILANRPDLKVARLNVETSYLELSVAKGSLLPVFSLTGGPGSRSEEFGDLLDKSFRTWELAGSITQPIFNAGRLRASVRRSEALRQASLANYRATALRAFEEVETLLANENYFNAEVSYLSQASVAAQSAAQSSWDRFRRGVQEIFDTLETQRRAFEAESRLLGIRKERIFNRINLFLAIGLPALPPET